MGNDASSWRQTATLSTSRGGPAGRQSMTIAPPPGHLPKPATSVSATQAPTKSQ